jgi:antitoxin component YwqK of YwqJK toxin-antitoxin module
MGIFDWLFGGKKTTPPKEEKEIIIKKPATKKSAVKTNTIETTHEIWYSSEKDLKSKDYYRDKKHNGPYMIFDNGKLEIEGKLKNGEDEGLIKYYRNDGLLYKEETFKDGEENGVSRDYKHDLKGDNKIRREEHYKEGKNHGIFLYRNDNGSTSSEGNYEEGKKHGISKFYSDEGNLEQEQSHKKGKKDGVWRTYHENGKIISESIFKDGKMLSSKDLYDGPFYFQIVEQEWFGKEESYWWCRVFRFFSLQHFNTLTGNGSYDHDEGPIGEFYYDVSTEKYVKWPEIKNDFTQNGFLECGDSISGEDFDGKTSELISYLRNKYGEDLRIDLISNMESTI